MKKYYFPNLETLVDYLIINYADQENFDMIHLHLMIYKLYAIYAGTYGTLDNYPEELLEISFKINNAGHVNVKNLRDYIDANTSETFEEGENAVLQYPEIFYKKLNFKIDTYIQGFIDNIAKQCLEIDIFELTDLVIQDKAVINALKTMYINNQDICEEYKEVYKKVEEEE